MQQVTLTDATPGIAPRRAAALRVSSVRPARVSKRVAVTDVRIVMTPFGSNPVSTALNAADERINKAAPMSRINARATSAVARLARRRV